MTGPLQKGSGIGKQHRLEGTIVHGYRNFGDGGSICIGVGFGHIIIRFGILRNHDSEALRSV